MNSNIPCFDPLEQFLGFFLLCWRTDCGVSGGAGGGAEGSSAGEGWISNDFAAGCKTEHCSGIPGSQTASSHITLMALRSTFLPSDCLSHLAMCTGCLLRFNFFQPSWGYFVSWTTKSPFVQRQMMSLSSPPCPMKLRFKDTASKLGFKNWSVSQHREIKEMRHNHSPAFPGIEM